MVEMVNVSMLKEYIYCPRNFWYCKFYNTRPTNYSKKDGKIKHENQSERGGWSKELYLKSKELQLKGKIDILEHQKNLPIERKKGEKIYMGDEIQLTGYCLLLEDHTDVCVEEGIIYLYGTDQRHKIKISDWHRKKTQETIKEILGLTVDTVPSFVDNEAKCNGCATKSLCMPLESKKLGERK